ncbi:MAG: hypothetical protein J6J45_06640 [Clostridia bacterium]|nr:hypothetical protein [Clostridia bacterium]
MKKIFALLLVAATVFAFAGCNVKDRVLPEATTAAEDFTAAYDSNIVVEAALKETLLKSYLMPHAELVEDVFVLSHLPVDKSAAIVHNGVNYAPVTDKAKYKTYGELLAKLQSLYTKEAIEKLLGNPAIYTEIDGKLYYNLDYSSGYFAGEGIYPYDWSEIEIDDNFTTKTDDTVQLRFYVIDAITENKVMISTMNAVLVDGEWKLDNFVAIQK